MVKLTVQNLHWIEPGDQPTDLCAHGTVELVVNDQVVVTHEDGDWCVSASALHLLRTVSRSHTRRDRIAEHLIPCCGHFLVPPADEDEEGEVTIIGCNHGVDWEIVHEGDTLRFILPDGAVARVSAADWREAVVGFSHAVRAFHAAAAPKTPHEDFERKGFESFMREWDRRRSETELGL